MLSLFKVDLAEQKTEAFNILKTKCNVYHSNENPSKVFTLENMNGIAKKINKQVFIWKRMPKGKSISLTKHEKLILKNWIKSLKS